MVALADRKELREARAGDQRRGWIRRRPHHRHAVHLLEMSSAGFHASAAEPPSAGEAIGVYVPALGLLDARVTWADGREFRAEFCGAADLRLLFLRKSFVGCSSWVERRSS
jgi:hypothetical protein